MKGARAKKQGTVYVIDDDESIQKAHKGLFRPVDLDVETFSSAEEFLCNPRQGQNACILIDIRMPSLTGFHLHQRLISRGIDLPVIVISASDDVLVCEHAKELGRRFLPKTR